MNLNIAYDIVNGDARVEDVANASEGELIQLLMGACLTDEGDIVCLECGLPNECCRCP